MYRVNSFNPVRLETSNPDTKSSKGEDPDKMILSGSAPFVKIKTIFRDIKTSCDHIKYIMDYPIIINLLYHFVWENP